jgi:hypothetical protein
MAFGCGPDELRSAVAHARPSRPPDSEPQLRNLRRDLYMMASTCVNVIDIYSSHRARAIEQAPRPAVFSRWSCTRPSASVYDRHWGARDVRNYCKLAEDTHAPVSGRRQDVEPAPGELYTPAQATTIKESWDILMRWSRFRTRRIYRRQHGILQETSKVWRAPYLSAGCSTLLRQQPVTWVHQSTPYPGDTCSPSSKTLAHGST